MPTETKSLAELQRQDPHGVQCAFGYGGGMNDNRRGARRLLRGAVDVAGMVVLVALVRFSFWVMDRLPGHASPTAPEIRRWYIEHVRDDQGEAVRFADGYLDYLAEDLRYGALSVEEYHKVFCIDTLDWEDYTIESPVR